MKDVFDVKLADAQATRVQPIAPEHFDLMRYHEYESALLERCRRFWEGDSGVLVYRRMRVAEVFAADSRSKERSLAWQLGALDASMRFKADVPNFLEPWHGLGTVASAFGFDYLWEPGQAPAVNGKFGGVKELLQADIRPVAETNIGRYTLEMTEYFLDKTRGMLPMSYCDVQSPLNTLSNVIHSDQFYTDFYEHPDEMHRAFNIASLLLSGFLCRQRDMIGDALASPGHGFASARCFCGLGMSDDTAIMMPPDIYDDFCIPAMVQTGSAFGGSVFHSCGNWSNRREQVVQIPNIRMADGAFSLATDPGANDPEGFADTFAHTGVVLNTRIVGSQELVEEKVRKLWRPGMKLIVVTYCETPAEQEALYDRIHRICEE